MVKICKYSGDASDEFCGKCDGITVTLEGGDAVQATTCGGYEAGEVDAPEEAAPFTPDPPAAAPPSRAAARATTPPPAAAPPAAKPAAAAKPATPPPAAKPAAATPPPVAAEVKPAKPVATPPAPVTTGEPGETVEIRAESGMTLEIKDKSGVSSWYKFGFTETRTVSATVNLEEEKADLWASVNNEVDNQVAGLVDSLK